MAATLLLLRRFSRLLKLLSSSSIPKYRSSSALLLESSISVEYTARLPSPSAFSSGRFWSRPSFNLDGDSQGPAAIDYLPEYGDIVQTDGFDVDYGWSIRI